MLRHIVLFRFVEDVSAEQVAAVSEALATLPGVIPELRRYAVGADLALVEGNWHYGVVAEFDDEAGWRRYRDHPEHLRIIAEVIRPIVAERAAVQIRG